MAPPSNLIAGRYRIVRPLGSGGMGKVFAVQRDAESDLLALKIIPHGSTGRFLDQIVTSELSSLSSLHHPNIVSLQDFGAVSEPDVGFFLVTELVEGKPLHQFCQESNGGAHLLTLLLQILQAVHYMHTRGFLHLDLKSNNILVERSPQGEPIAKIIDFGTARAMGRGQLSTIMGTPSHMAPEMRARGEVDVRTDLFALGVMLENILPLATGVGPEDFETLQLLSTRLRETQPYRRFQNAEQVVGFILARSQHWLLPNDTQLHLGRLKPLAWIGDDSALRSTLTTLGEFLEKKSSCRLVTLSGDRGTGKTRVLEELRVFFASERLLWLQADPKHNENLLSIFIKNFTSGEEKSGAAIESDQIDLAIRSFTRVPLEKAVAVVVDDFALLSKLEIEFLSRLADIQKGSKVARIIFIATHSAPITPDFLGLFEDDEKTALAIQALADTKSVELFLKNMFPEIPVEPAFCRRLWEISQGIPGKILQMLRAYFMAQTSFPPIPWNLERLNQSTPANFKEAIRGLFEKLPATNRQLLQHLALFERPVPDWVFRALAKAFGQNLVSWPDELLPWLEHSWESGIACTAFQNQWFQEYLVKNATPEQAEQFHQAALKVWNDFKDIEFPGRSYFLAVHALGAKDWDAVLDYGRTWITTASSHYNWSGADHFLKRAASQLPAGQHRDWALGERARVLLFNGNLNDAEKILADLCKRNSKSIEWFELLIEVGRRTGKPSLVEGAINRLLELSLTPATQQLVDVARAEAAVLKGEYHWARDDLERQLKKGSTEAQPLILRALLAFALANHYLEEWTVALEALNRAKELAIALGSLNDQITALYRTGIVQMRLRNFGAAIQVFKEAESLAWRTGDTGRRLTIMINLGTTYQEESDFNSAHEAYKQALAIAFNRGDLTNQAVAAMNLSYLQNQLGLHREAANNLIHALSIIENNRLHTLLIPALLFGADIHAALEDFDQAREMAVRARKLLRQQKGGEQRLTITFLHLCHAHYGIAWAEGVGLSRVHYYARRALQLAENSGLGIEILGYALWWEARSLGPKERIAILDLLTSKLAAPTNRDSFAKLDLICRTLALQLEAWRALNESEKLLQTRLALVNAWKRLLNLVPEKWRRPFEDSPTNRIISQNIEATVEIKIGTPQNPPMDITSTLGLPPEQQLEKVLGIITRFSTLSDPNALLEVILDTMIEMAQASRGQVLIYEHETLQVRATSSVDDSISTMSRSIALQALRDGKALISDSAENDARFNSLKTVIDLRPGAVVCLPMSWQGSTIGVIYLERPQVTNPSAVNVLQALANQAAMALYFCQSLFQLKQSQWQLNQDLSEQSSIVDNQAKKILAQNRVIERYQDLRLVTQSPKMIKLVRNLKKAAAKMMSVVFFGETGVGKEELAHLLHQHSRNAGKQFLAINCSALSPTLLESELFGHEAGSFTGASQRHIGIFEQVDEGTIFLDEVAEMPLPMQAKLLRILESGEFRRVGGSENLISRAYVIAASNKDLKKSVERGHFRNDLYFRLAKFEINVPPLRERLEDIPLLVQQFIEKSDHPHLKISPAAVDLLIRHQWPGNVRELKNVVERAIIFAKGPTIESQHLVFAGAAGDGDQQGPEEIAFRRWVEDRLNKGSNYEEMIAGLEKRLLSELLEVQGMRRTGLAEKLKIPRRTLYYKLKLFGFTTKD